MNSLRVAPLLLAAAFLSSCASERTSADPVDRFRVVHGSPNSPHKPLKFGKGLEGRMENGTKVYTVLVTMDIAEGGKVTHAHVSRSDAPERLQWATVRALKKTRQDPSLKPGRYMKPVIYRGFEAKPG